MAEHQAKKINGVHFHNLFKDFTIECVNEELTHHDKKVQIEIEKLNEEFDIQEIKEGGHSEE